MAATGFMTPYSSQVQPKFDGQDRPTPRFVDGCECCAKRTPFLNLFKGMDNFRGSKFMIPSKIDGLVPKFMIPKMDGLVP